MIDTENTYTLLDAVDDLTRPRRRRAKSAILRKGEIVGQQEITIEDASLLDQLSEAIRANLGGTSAGASLASERNLLDTDALYKLILIDAQIRDWCRGMKLIPTADTAPNLRAWYVEYAKYTHPAEVDTSHVKTLGKWAAQIRSKLDPWRERDLPDECPTCGAKTWWRDGAEYFRPLVVRYKPTGPDLVQEARAFCRSCEQTWHIRELAYELEQKHAEGAA